MSDPINNPDPYAAQLSQATTILTEQLNEGLAKYEQHLYDLRLSATAEITLDEGHLLGFGKINREWHIYVRTNNPDSERQRLGNHSRKIRVKVVPLLQDLKAALLKASEQQIEELKQAVAALQVLTADPESTPS